MESSIVIMGYKASAINEQPLQVHSDMIAEEMDANKFSSLAPGPPVPVQAQSPAVDMHEPASSEQVNKIFYDHEAVSKTLEEIIITLKQISRNLTPRLLRYNKDIALSEKDNEILMQVHSDMIAAGVDANIFSSLAPGSVLEPVSPVVSSSTAYPIIDSSDAGRPNPVQASSPAVDMHVPASSEQVNKKNVHKQTDELETDELEEMEIKSKRSRRTVTNWDGILAQ